MIHQSKPRRTVARNTSPPTTPPAIVPALLCALPLEESDADVEKLEAVGALVEKSIVLALAWLVEEEEVISGTAVVFAMSAV